MNIEKYWVWLVGAKHCFALGAACRAPTDALD